MVYTKNNRVRVITKTITKINFYKTMNQKNFKLLIVISLFIAVVSCGKDNTLESYVNVSDSTCSFNYEGGTETINIEASDSDWHAECAATWVSLEHSGNKLIISVSPNTSSTERQANVTVISGSAGTNIAVYQNGYNSMEVIYRDVHGEISPNGYFEIGIYLTSSSSEKYYLRVRNMREDTYEDFGPYFSYDYPVYSVIAVTDSGDAFLTSSTSLTSGTVYYFNRETGSITRFDNKCYIQYSVADGNIAVGYNSDPDLGIMAQYTPVLWENGEKHILPVPDKPFRQTRNWSTGVIPQGISDDASIIWGIEWESIDLFCLWWDENRDWHYVGQDVRKLETVMADNGYGRGELVEYTMASGFFNLADYRSMSNTGTWISGWFYEETLDDDNFVNAKYYPAFYNFKEQKTYIFRDYPSAYACAVNDDGTGFIATVLTPFEGDPSMCDFYAVDIRSGSTIGTLQDWVYNTYGIFIPQKTYVLSFSSDGKVMISSDTYIVDNRLSR